ncbi:hypothetical protein JXK06_01930 [Patescibacteria group bacterium]|nr:hypothetical protein [Patescibacteria group bacterium]
MDKKSIREIIIASSLYSIGSILGPLLVFGGFGLILDRVFDTKPVALLINIFVAFIITNVLLFKKIKKINGMMDAYRDEIKEVPEKPDLPKIN